MSENTINALMLGDVCGQPGLRALFIGLRQLIKDTRADIVVINGENAANGFGLSAELMNQIFTDGADVITSGNHIWQIEDIFPYLDSERRLLRPANYPSSVPGHGSVVVDIKGTKVGVINLQGRQTMPITDDPFRCANELVGKIRKETPIILVDFHAESPEEKESLSFYLDGKISVLVGTHTHVQTNDEKILPEGTGYITDLGICGPMESVIGSDYNVSIEKQLTQLPIKNVISDNPPMINGICAKIDKSTGKCLSIEKINRKIGF